MLASGLPSQFALGALLFGLGLTPYTAAGELSISYVGLLLTLDTLILIGFVVWRLWAAGERPLAPLLGTAPWRLEAWVGLTLMPLLFGGIAVLMATLRWAWPALHNVDANPFAALARTPLNATVLMFLVVLSGGLKEEVQRAFILHRFEHRLGGATLGLVLYSTVFGAGHLIQGYDVGIATLLLGVAWGLLFLRRRSIVAPAVCHALFNAAQIVQFLVTGS